MSPTFLPVKRGNANLKSCLDFALIRDHHDDEPQTAASQELARYEEYIRRELPRCFRKALEAAVDNEIRGVGDRLRGQLLTLLDKAQKQAFDNYHAAHSVAAGIVATSSQSDQDSDGIGDNGNYPDSTTRHESEGISGTDYEDQGHPLGHNNTPFAARSGLTEPEITDNSTSNSTTESTLDKVSEVETPDKDVPIKQFELDRLNYSYEHWLTSSDGIDLDLLFSDCNW